MKWFRKHRPIVHFWFWAALLAINLGMAAICTWAGNKYSIPMNIEVIFFIIMSLLSFMMTRVWRHWLDNPNDYEKLYNERLRRLGRRMGRGRRKRKDKKKDSKE